MSHFSGYGAYMLFLALRTHFTKDKYDFFQMHGKLRATKESYLKRNDKGFFSVLAKEYNTEELKDYYIANLLEDKHYIMEFTDDAAEMVYTDYTRRRQSLSYICSNELDRVFDKGLKDGFTVRDDTYPDIVMLYMRRTISIETMVILNDFLRFTDKFDKYYDNDVIWPKVSLKIKKYRPFLKYDKNKMKLILKEKVNENSRGQCI